MFYTRFLLVAATVAVVVAQDGTPIDDARTVNRTEPAANVFGTTTQSINWTSMPDTLCIVPMYTNEAGMGSDTKTLTAQQALELCPRAERIAVHNE
ncbi:unnamed protein product [Rhizoctonia solani]|uniref:Uncharacterized protein n=1 Tax=Rhizoctonia solani TaxID=456999 RepID=A0A8H3CQ78_9AGAM|nr:unnamed protein product [Rhizoctonia solani]